MIIAIDGPAASGKGTIARKLAAHYGLRHLDTGMLYRAVAARLIAAGASLDDPAARLEAARGLAMENLADEAQLRGPGMGEAASIVAADPAVRAAMLDFQRNFARTPPGAVLDGRDIATVVCPDADAKLFVTAAAETRARRRFKEIIAAGGDVSYEQVLADIRRRDARDTARAVAPLRKADDAHLLDTTDLDIEAAFRAAVDLIGGSTAAK
ncbi:cytidylate kinase [Tepidamorphus gemmatus]|jgi:cytidylate kinase|uniref:Cytidylate kinase n=1 Tax=Tepidamorphus gemmatus TaxID=747076 RepID=A0A4R3MB04_9HYPH|nr:(d)CMP kinase [Tepidamorphus gemmatus]TCT10690.1 cytidylate kinase [Tepidamorphus gemmatus]